MPPTSGSRVEWLEDKVADFTRGPISWFSFSHEYKFTNKVIGTGSGGVKRSATYVMVVCKGRDCSYAAKIARVDSEDKDRFIRMCVITKVAGEIEVSPKLMRAWISHHDQLSTLGLSKEILHTLKHEDPTEVYGITIMEYFQDSRSITPEDLSTDLPSQLARYGVTMEEYSEYWQSERGKALPIRKAPRDLVPELRKFSAEDNSDVQNLLFQTLKRMWVAGISHNDLHNENILISKDRKTIRIIDFDRANVADGKEINPVWEVCGGGGFGIAHVFFNVLCEALKPKIQQDPILSQFASRL